MSKRLLIILFSALLLSSFASCKKDVKDDEVNTDGQDTIETTGGTSSYIDVNPVNPNNPGNNPGNSSYDESNQTEIDPSETAPEFKEVSKKVVVISSVATIRTDTVLDNSNAVAWPSEGAVIDVIAESDNWYKLQYKVNDKKIDCYLAKTVAAEASVLDKFTEFEEVEEVIVTVDTVYVRSYPSTSTTNSIRGVLKKGDKITRVATNGNWSKIEYELVSQIEFDDDGNPIVETKYYYVSNDCLNVEDETIVETETEVTVEPETTAEDESESTVDTDVDSDTKAPDDNEMTETVGSDEN